MFFKKGIVRLFLVFVLCLLLAIGAFGCSVENLWDGLGGGGTAEVQENEDTSDTDTLSEAGESILRTALRTSSQISFFGCTFISFTFFYIAASIPKIEAKLRLFFSDN